MFPVFCFPHVLFTSLISPAHLFHISHNNHSHCCWPILSVSPPAPHVCIFACVVLSLSVDYCVSKLSLWLFLPNFCMSLYFFPWISLCLSFVTYFFFFLHFGFHIGHQLIKAHFLFSTCLPPCQWVIGTFGQCETDITLINEKPVLQTGSCSVKDMGVLLHDDNRILHFLELDS